MMSSCILQAERREKRSQNERERKSGMGRGGGEREREKEAGSRRQPHLWQPSCAQGEARLALPPQMQLGPRCFWNAEVIL